MSDSNTITTKISPNMRLRLPEFFSCLAFLFFSVLPYSRAEIPSLLTDKIYKGAGTIDLLVDVSAQDLASYLDSGTLYLGVDLNENAEGNENRDSIGIAIEQLELVIVTTNGEFTFSEFYTNTTAMIQGQGTSSPSEYFTMFGTLGSSQLTGGTPNFDISTFDDVIQVEKIVVDGEILSAELRVQFLNTSGSGANETFFDYSGGFEDFAIFSAEDAQLLDSASIGLADAPLDQIQFTQYSSIDAAIGAPAPSVLTLAVIPLLIMLKTGAQLRRNR